MSGADNGRPLRIAGCDDVPAIVAIVNAAFEVENFFKNEPRISSDGVLEMMREGSFLLLEDAGHLTACVFVKHTGDRVYIGLLSVDPAQQSKGIGKHMMAEAEKRGRVAGAKVADIRVVNLRTELLPLYRKFGYAESGTEEISADITQKFTRPVHFIRMSKVL